MSKTVSKKDRENYKKLIEENENKIQIRVPIWVYNVLDNDLSTYTLTQDGNPNMTTIVSRILMSINEYRKYLRETRIKILELGDAYAADFYNVKTVNEDAEERLSNLSNEEELFVNGTLQLLSDEEKKSHSKGTVRIDIHKTLTNASVLMSITRLCNGELTIGMYIKSVLEWYALKPGYERERILFSKTAKEIRSKLKENSEKVHYYDIIMKNGFTAVIKPYALAHDPDGIHNYLLGITTYTNRVTGQTGLKATTLRLDNIEDNVSEIFCIHDELPSESFSDDEVNTLELMKKNNPGYTYFSLRNDLYKVRFNKFTESKYNSVYSQRPKFVERKENSDGTIDYTFDCSTRQINQYLIRLMTSFNSNEIEKAQIEILEPQGFKDNFKNYYLKFANILKD